MNLKRFFYFQKETGGKGAVAGRAVNSVIESCETEVTLDGEALQAQTGETDVMYESADQAEEEEKGAA